ncbi:hypothetical protein G5714_009470 [Onychostoma macrolepis]|uniref:Coiled-coil domain-containing protein n=2 Tax=Onychostoma macrolepis TaxID=369639 RepID=A0A7J6CSC4_9TELE|nr:hypothetical protein G5714_009470 [Onychostoma macrolepis]
MQCTVSFKVALNETLQLYRGGLRRRANNTPAGWHRKREVPGMPKKFQGENSKSATAKARKAEAKAVADARKQKELEDALWQDNDKHVMKKEQRRDDKEKKRLEALERKREKQRLFEEEEAKIKGKQPKEAPSKVTRAQIEENLQSGQNVKETKEKEKCHLDVPLEENVNRIVPEEGTVEARTIEDAISVLSTKEDLDRHPERRMKAAYAAFEEANMARLKMENPNMRLSQLKQQLKKEWTKCPENPLNQRVATYNSKYTSDGHKRSLTPVGRSGRKGN